MSLSGPVITVTVEDVRDIQKQGETRMVSRNLKRFAASNGTVALVLTGMLVLGSGLTANAQSESAGSHHGLQGAWRLTVTVRQVTDPQTGNCQTGEALRPPFAALFAFAKGGTATNTTAGQFPGLFTSGVGVWGHTEGNTYRAVLENFVFSPAGAWIQTHRFTHTIEVDNDADQFTETIALEILDTSGNVIAPGCGTGVGTRFK
jgi:hypothetical protein